MADDDEDVAELEDEYESPRSGRVAFARIEALTLNATADPLGALMAALIPGTRIQRHNRTWYMAQVRREGASLVGKIGFQSEGTVAEIWDEESKDFREEVLPAGTTSPFAIDPEALRVAFQLRPGIIRVKSFTGALQALLNAASPADRWRVEQEVEEVAFTDWTESVDRVLRLRVRLRPPNPHYGDRVRVRELVEGANARMTEVIWQADRDSLDGIDVNDEFVREAIEHAQKYGTIAARGERAGRETVWASTQEAAAEERVAEADPLTREVRADALRQQLGDATVSTPTDEGGIIQEPPRDHE